MHLNSTNNFESEINPKPLEPLNGKQIETPEKENSQLERLSSDVNATFESINNLIKTIHQKEIDGDSISRNASVEIINISGALENLSNKIDDLRTQIIKAD